MSSIWNFTNPLTTGSLRLAHSGRELYGTVIKAGVNQKTVTVKVNRFFYVQKYKKTFSRTGRFQVHDEAETCVLGDKVVIQTCRPMSKTKRYFVRNIVVMGGRPFTVKGSIEPEVPQIESTETKTIPEVKKPKEVKKKSKRDLKNTIKTSEKKATSDK